MLWIVDPRHFFETLEISSPDPFIYSFFSVLWGKYLKFLKLVKISNKIYKRLFQSGWSVRGTCAMCLDITDHHCSTFDLKKFSVILKTGLRYIIVVPAHHSRLRNTFTIDDRRHLLHTLKYLMDIMNTLHFTLQHENTHTNR